MNIYTIGFSGKSAETFFTLLTDNKVRSLTDIRLNNKSQLAGFANVKHLPYFLDLHNITYDYRPEFAPTKELLDGYKKNGLSWQEYEKRYLQILEQRNVLAKTEISDFADTVFLCSEPTAEKCHRRLLAEFLAEQEKSITVVHL